MRQLILGALIALCAIFLTVGCGDSCSQEDVNACTTSYSTCNAGCVANPSCLDSCQAQFCSCMDAAACDPPSECSAY